MQRLLKLTSILAATAIAISTVTGFAENNIVGKDGDLTEIYGEDYIIWTNESAESRDNAFETIGDWTTSNNLLVGEVTQDEQHGNVLEITYEKTKQHYGTFSFNQSQWKDVSKYKYLSFWYKGTGNTDANKFSLSFKNGGTTVRTIVLTLENNDTDWHFYQEEIEGNWSATTLTGINPKYDNQVYDTVYIDDIAFSVDRPYDDGSTPPSEEPTTEPTEEPSVEPSTEPEPTQTPSESDLNDVYGETGTFIVETLETGESRYNAFSAMGTWQAGVNLSSEILSDAEHGNVKKVKASQNNGYQRSAALYTAWQDISDYQYLSFWYKGSADSSNTLYLVFKNNDDTVREVSLPVPADDEWRFYSEKISDEDWKEKTITGLNLKLANIGEVYYDDIAFSIEMPNIETDPVVTPEPTPEATIAPPQDMGVKEKIGRVDNNEITGGFVSWKSGTDCAVSAENGAIKFATTAKNKYSTNSFYLENDSVTGAVDLSGYKYFGVNYKGSGKANTLKFALKSGSQNVFVIEIPVAADDTNWHNIEINLNLTLDEINAQYENVSVSAYDKAKMASVSAMNVAVTEPDEIYISDFGIYSYAYEIEDFSIGQGNVNGNLGKGSYTVTGNVIRGCESTEPVYAIIAVYDENANLYKTILPEVDMSSTEKALEEQIDITEEGKYTIKLMLWASLDTMKPLVEVVK